MNKRVNKNFLYKVIESCNDCFIIIPKMNMYLKNNSAKEFFNEVHQLIRLSADISKIFYPPKNRKVALQRGRALRAMIGLPIDHIIKDRSLRNHLEHYDERLDTWDEESKTHNIGSNIIASRNGIVGISNKDIINKFDPDTYIYYFRGEQYNIQELVRGIEDVFKKVNNIL